MKNKGTVFVKKVLPNVVELTAGNDEVDIEDALDIAGNGRYNYLLLLTCSIIHLGAVVDMLGFSVIAPEVSCDLQLGIKESGMLTSVSFAGFMFALPWGYLADTHGRRRALIVSASVGFVFSALSSFATSFAVLLSLKFIGCSFSTASLTITITYLGECTSRKHRSKFIFIQNVACLGADFVCFALAYLILPMNFNIQIPWLFVYRPWRLLTLVMSFPLGIGAVMVLFLHESPKFLANKGETEEALNVLKRTYEINGGSKEFYPVKSLIANERREDSISFLDSIAKQTLPIFKPPLLWKTMQLFLLFAICCSTNNVFFMWFPTLVNSFFNIVAESVDEMSFCEKIMPNFSDPINDTMEFFCDEITPLNTIHSGMLFTLFFTSMTVVAVKLAAWKKTLLIVVFIISGISSILVNLIDGHITNIVLFIMIQLIGICTGNIGSYFVDFYPTSYRGLATSLGMMVARFACLGGVNLVGAVIVDHCTLTFYSWAVFIFSGVGVALFLPSDKKADK